MDVFFEQIVEKKKNAKEYVLLALIWFAVAAIAIFIMLNAALLGPITLLPIIAIGYGAYKISMNFFVEYEYIITNGTLDIDKIVAKSSRKRVASIELSSVDSLERYTPASKPKAGYERIVIACDESDNNAYAIVVVKEGRGRQYIVFSPNDKIKGAVVKFLPKFIANSAFK
ncbi:MAG: hypothetical protein J6J13_04460 [Clostridia bacterium]|nr:hypothetical protein [Clostridia bacterium]